MGGATVAPPVGISTTVEGTSEVGSKGATGLVSSWTPPRALISLLAGTARWLLAGVVELEAKANRDPARRKELAVTLIIWQGGRWGGGGAPD